MYTWVDCACPRSGQLLEFTSFRLTKSQNGDSPEVNLTIFKRIKKSIYTSRYLDLTITIMKI